MFAKLSLRLPALALLLAVTPLAAAAQESSPDVQESDTQPATQRVAEDQPVSDSGSVIIALRSSSDYAALLAPPAVDLPTAEELSIMDEQTPAAAAAPSKGSGTGLGFMIGGAAALVGGLLIGGTGGNIIAAGGVALGVYGAIVYF